MPQPGAPVKVGSIGIPCTLSAACFDVRATHRLGADVIHTLGIPEPLGLNDVVQVLADIAENAAVLYDQSGFVDIALHALQDWAKPYLHFAESTFSGPVHR